MDLEQLSNFLATLGCPKDKTGEMAAQLDKRARQLSETNGTTYEHSMAHLISLMKQGWAAQERGF